MSTRPAIWSWGLGSLLGDEEYNTEQLDDADGKDAEGEERSEGIAEADEHFRVYAPSLRKHPAAAARPAAEEAHPDKGGDADAFAESHKPWLKPSP